MRPCPNCGQPVPEGQDMCPHCGLVLPKPEASSVWPPAPVGVLDAPAPPAPRLLTRYAWLDFGLGFLLSLASTLVYCIGAVGALAVYFIQRPKHPVFARGVGWGLVLVGALLLGAMAVCFYSLANGGRH